MTYSHEIMNETLLAGSLLILSTGEYSDYNYHGPFKVLKGFSRAAAAEAFVIAWPQYRTDVNTARGWQQFDEDDGPDPSAFMDWLIKEGWIEALDCPEWHVGSYSRFSPKGSGL